VRARLTGPAADWAVRPDAGARGGDGDPGDAPIADRLDPRASGAARFALTVPESQALGTVSSGARVRYTFADEEVVSSEPFEVEVVSALSAESVTATPSPARPGATVQVTATLRNAGGAPIAGTVQIGVPSGWTAPAPAAATVPAGGAADVTVAVAVPRDAPQAAQDITLTAAFVRDGAELAKASGSLRVEIAPLANAIDHVDLGNAASEQAHALTASASSGTSTEAGLTRRYAGHLTPFSQFEFDLKVVAGEPFVLRAIETYDRAQTKRYKVYVDGRQVLLRTFSRGSGGTETYEFAVPASADDTVRVRFENQDDPAFYDPSIADVWTLPS
jgi:hypothetical protein